MFIVLDLELLSSKCLSLSLSQSVSLVGVHRVHIGAQWHWVERVWAQLGTAQSWWPPIISFMRPSAVGELEEEQENEEEGRIWGEFWEGGAGADWTLGHPWGRDLIWSEPRAADQLLCYSTWLGLLVARSNMIWAARSSAPNSQPPLYEYDTIW